MGMTEVEKLIEIYKKVEDAGLMVIAGKKDSAELMVAHDVVPVVRCKDCKGYDHTGDFCEFLNGVRHPEHFCGEGERKDNV